ncbi:Sec23/Sec24 domain containing protein [Theileria equi strain WA]|uniref:Sec23/Sec24 domain containing protein n=1 Tax=Theileria equi strain WA TaxID=1537102 RepID=L0AY82_THEEQ|nr:Sec23/Sec24 domain containing protein [Theileria equi strain WA]AFZ80218.1 Sec23/Sec24 domain containing protein [Theileria equi strain WA]|eukprot:XP_004829884.1 Sec23/Sec24 domain containing protein [Theileria equi strain WA]
MDHNDERKSPVPLSQSPPGSSAPPILPKAKLVDPPSVSNTHGQSSNVLKNVSFGVLGPKKPKDVSPKITNDTPRIQSMDNDVTLDSIASDSGILSTKEQPKAVYVNQDLQKHIFTYGPYVPSKIESSQVPRPSNMLRNTTSEVIYETGKTSGLIPTFGNHRIIDTGSASPIYITPTLAELPLYGESLSNIKLPFGVVVQPFAENVDENVPMIDFIAEMGGKDTRCDLIRCTKCQAYHNPAMEDNSRHNVRICNFCYSSFNLTTAQADTLEKIRLMYRDTLSPLTKGSIDYIAPKHYYTNVTVDTPIESLTSNISNLLGKAGSITNIRLPSLTKQTDEPTVFEDYADLEKSRNTAFQVHTIGNNSATKSTQDTMINSLSLSPKIDYKAVPSYIFVVETTVASNTIGLKESVLSAIKNALSNCGNFVRFCVITYDCVVHLYPIVGGELAMYYVAEVDESFTPCTPGDLFLEVDGDLTQVSSYLDQILSVSILKIGSQTCSNFALNVAVRLLGDSKSCGTVTMFYCSIPDVGIGISRNSKITNDFNLTDSQKIYYDSLIQTCYESGISVDLYICPVDSRIPGDIALQYITQQTAGKCHYMSYFNGKNDYLKIYNDILRLFTLQCGYNCELKLRASKAIAINEVICPFSNSRAIINNSTVKVPKLGPDTALAFTLSLDDLIDNRHALYLQCACMYNSSLNGQKMIRVHTSTVRVTTSINQIFKNTNCDAVMNIYMRKLSRAFIKTGKFPKKDFMNSVVHSLTSYRHLCAPSTPSNQLILPDNLKLLPITLNALFKHETTDENEPEYIQKLLRALLAPVKETAFMCPRVFCLYRTVNDDSNGIPASGWKFNANIVPASSSNIYSDGMYIMDDGHKLLLYFGPHVKWELLQQLFGQNLVLDDKSANSLALVESETTTNFLECVDQIRAVHSGCQYIPLKILPYTSKIGKMIKLLLLEDERGEEPSYINFLVRLHKLIKQAHTNLL